MAIATMAIAPVTIPTIVFATVVSRATDHWQPLPRIDSMWSLNCRPACIKDQAIKI